MNTVSKHYINRAKERTTIKNRRTNERIADLALLRGKRSENYNHREQKYLSNREGRDCLAIAYNGFCYIFSQEHCCITTYALPEWFGKRPHYAGKVIIRDFKKYCKYNQALEDRDMIS